MLKNANSSLGYQRAIKLRPFVSVMVLVGALREERHKDHQVGKGKKPSIGINAGGFGGASNESKMAALGEIVDVLDANARKSSDFRIGEYLLAGLHSNHGPLLKTEPDLFLLHLTRLYRIRCCRHLICSYQL